MSVTIKISTFYYKKDNSLSIHQNTSNIDDSYYYNSVLNSKNRLLINKSIYVIKNLEDHLFHVRYIPLKLENLYIKGNITLYSNDIKFPMEITFVNSILKETSFEEHKIRIE